MDWKLPELRFKHIRKVRDATGFDLTDLEKCAELDSIYQLGPVVETLTKMSRDEFNDAFVGDHIADAYDQLIERLTEFFPKQKALMLQEVARRIKAVYAEASGEMSTN